MTKQVRRTTSCHRDLVEIAVFIGQEDPAAAERFLDGIDAVCKTLSHFPTWGSRFESTNPKHEGVRVVAVPKFANHLVFYRVVGDTVEILRVIHGARDLPNAFDS